MKTLITGIALGAIGYSLYSGLRRQQAAHPDAVKPEPLMRWEDEGGNVPAANTALSAARTDDLLAPGSQNDALREPIVSSAPRKPGVSGSVG